MLRRKATDLTDPRKVSILWKKKMSSILVLLNKRKKRILLLQI